MKDSKKGLKFPLFLVKRGVIVLRDEGLRSFFERLTALLFGKVHQRIVMDKKKKLVPVRDTFTEIKGMVSVIIPVYDRTIELQKSIESILNQTYTNFELILVTDGSPAETIAVVKGYEHNPRVRVFYYDDNTGNAVRGRNRGIKEAKGEFIAFQDSDDVAESHRLEVSIKEINAHSADIVYGGWRADLDGTRHIAGVKNGEEIICPECNFLKLKNVCIPYQSTVMIRKQILYAVGGYKEIMRYREDHELWLRLSFFGYKFKMIPQILTNIRLHKGNNELNFKGDDKKWKALMLREYKIKISC